VLGGYPNKNKWIEAKTNLIHVEKIDKLDPFGEHCSRNSIAWAQIFADSKKMGKERQECNQKLFF